MTRRSSLMAELNRQFAENPRLKLALPLIAALLLLLAWQELDNLRLQTAKDAQTERAKLERMKSLRGQDEWLQRQERSATVRDAIRAELPTAATAGLAQAALQTSLGTMVRSLGTARDVRINVSPVGDDSLPADVIRVRGSVNGGMNARQALMLLQKIESATNLLVVETVDIRSGSNHTAAITFSAYYRVTPEDVGP